MDTDIEYALIWLASDVVITVLFSFFARKVVDKNGDGKVNLGKLLKATATNTNTITNKNTITTSTRLT
jgi:hypothetical protein